MKIEDIKNELVTSCIEGNSKRFIPFLLSEKVKTEMPNKMRFYQFFKRMVNCSKEKSIGEWKLRIEKAKWIEDNNSFSYNFYDQKHKYARLTILVREKNDEIYLGTMPF